MLEFLDATACGALCTGTGCPPAAFQGAGAQILDALDGTAVTELGTELGGRCGIAAEGTELGGRCGIAADGTELGGRDGIGSVGTGVITSTIG